MKHIIKHRHLLLSQVGVFVVLLSSDMAVETLGIVIYSVFFGMYVRERVG